MSIAKSIVNYQEKIKKLNQELYRDLAELEKKEKEEKTKKIQVKIKNDNLELVKDLNKLEGEKDIKKIKKIIKKRGYKYTKIDKYIDKKLGKYAPKQIYIKNLKYAGKEIVAIKFDKNKLLDTNFTIKKIQKIGDDFTQYLQRKGVNGKMMITTLYGDLGWRSGELRDIGEDVYLYDPDDYYDNNNIEKPKNIKSFYMFIKLGNKAQGGNDKHNDCLYNCLEKYIFDLERYFKSPADLKKFLKLNRDDKIPVSCLDKIEEKLKTYQINVRGEYIRSSTVKTHKQINLILSNEHFEVEKSNKRSLTPYIKFNEKKPLLYDKLTFEGFDGVKKWILTKKEKNSIIYNHNSEYILINREEQRDENNNVIQITIEEEYKELIDIIEELKRETKGLINLYKTGSYKYAALDLFDRFNKHLNAEDILQDEAYWINQSSFSALIWAEEYEGEMYKYDMVSYYSYLITLFTNRFPLKRGDFNIIDDLSEILEFGIYR